MNLWSCEELEGGRVSEYHHVVHDGWAEPVGGDGAMDILGGHPGHGGVHAEPAAQGIRQLLPNVGAQVHQLLHPLRPVRNPRVLWRRQQRDLRPRAGQFPFLQLSDVDTIYHSMYPTFHSISATCIYHSTSKNITKYSTVVSSTSVCDLTVLYT